MEGRRLVIIKSLLPRSCQGFSGNQISDGAREGTYNRPLCKSPRPFSERSSVDGAEARHKAQIDAGQQQIAEVMNMIVVLTQKSVNGRTEKFRFFFFS